MEIGNTFLKNIYNEDIIYHYTKASTAIDYIFYNNELLFQQARKSNDPTESKKADRRISFYDADVNRVKTQQEYHDLDELNIFLEDLEDRFYQICFCQNLIDEDNFEFLRLNGQEELLGFTKLRMWDQYADKFSGVCIAFSKKQILSQNNKKFDIIEDKIKYLKFQDLFSKKPGNIQGTHLLNVGKEKYKEQLEKAVKESFFCKHIDYEGENEYRIGTLFDKNKCSFEKIRGEYYFDKSMKLDISGCVKAIFVSSYANERQKNDLLEFANQYNVEMVEMNWQNDSFIPVDYKNRNIF